MAILTSFAFDLLAEVFRRAADHQAGDEHGQNCEHADAVQAQPTPPKMTFAELHLEKGDHAGRAACSCRAWR